jgi:ABC-type polysaccharide/polyol phosphate transport system ATPase subunit
MPAVIELRSLGKRYQKLDQQPTLLRSLVPVKRETRQDLWAVRDVDLEVEQGEAIGVLGHNGAGKTTLLRLLAGVTRPTTGHVRVRGRVGPLISLGVGFHHELTGRENVLVNGTLLGLDAEQVRARFDEIVEFAELEKFIDTPVKFYSSGMYMRLGFAIIAHIDPTVLLVDEVLAVGDARFQQKCFARLRALREEGATIVMVSHSVYMVRQLCDRAVGMSHGRVVYDGDIDEAIARHQRSASSALEPGVEAPLEFVACEFGEGGGEWRHAAPDELVELGLRVRFHRRVEDPVITVGAMTEMGVIAGFVSSSQADSWRTFEPGEEAGLHVTFPVHLGGGTYRLIVDVKDGAGAERLARSDDLILKVAERDGSSGLADVRAEIELTESRPAEIQQT